MILVFRVWWTNSHYLTVHCIWIQYIKIINNVPPPLAACCFCVVSRCIYINYVPCCNDYKTLNIHLIVHKNTHTRVCNSLQCGHYAYFGSLSRVITVAIHACHIMYDLYVHYTYWQLCLAVFIVVLVVDRTASPPGGYSQYIPAKDSGIGFHRLGPPLLPAHLLETVLNKDVPLHVRTSCR